MEQLPAEKVEGDIDEPEKTEEEKYETFEEHMAEIGQEKTIDRAEEDKKYFEVFEKFRFDGHAIFTDIDGTLTDNEGNFDERAIEYIKEYVKSGGIFVPVTGRARFESVRKIMEVLDLPYIVMNNGAEIYDREGNCIYRNEIPPEQVKQAYAIAEKHGLIWMQNKKNPETGEEYLYSNYTEDTEREMNEVGIKDTPQNEVGRIGLPLKKATAEEVMAINDANLKIQMMSPDYKAVSAAHDELESHGISCMLNMQSAKTGEHHWVEVIQGTKIDGIQWLVNSGLIGDVKTAQVVGDGGNDLTMFKELHNREGEPIPNLYTAVANASDKVKEVAHKILQSRYDDAIRGLGKGGAMVEIFEDQAKIREVQVFVNIISHLLERGVPETRVINFVEERIKRQKTADSNQTSNGIQEISVA